MKKAFLYLFFFILIAAVALFIGLLYPAEASAYSSSFENSGQLENWGIPKITGSGEITTTTAEAYTGNTSVFFHNKGSGIGTLLNEELENLSVGKFSFWFKKEGSTSTAGFGVILSDALTGATALILSDYASELPNDNDWHKFQIEWKADKTSQSCIDTTCEAWENWDTSVGTEMKYIQTIAAGWGTTWFYIDDLVFGTLSSSLTITSPASGSTASTTFPLEMTYNLAGENVNKIMTIFESWNVSSTCPDYGSDVWTTEYNAGWFFSQSAPFFSPHLTATSTTATTSTSVYNLDEPYFYNCVKCFFYNIDTASSTFQNKCPTYTLNVAGFIPPSQPLPIGSWESYYASHTDAKFPTSTAIFDTITGSFSGIVQKLAAFINDFRAIFDSESAYTKGASLGSNVPLARGYLKPINDFFGSLPVSEIFIFLIIVLLVVNVYRIVKTILQLIRG